jgi:hypothetical protein
MGDPRDEEDAGQSRFKVTDRRKFTPEGEMRTPSETEANQEPPSSEARQAPQPAESVGDPQKSPSGETSESVDFASFLLSLATTGMVHLGEIPEPMTGQPAENLEGARQMIDILSLLKEKTEGNLSAEENRLLDGLLYELRMKFLSKSKTIKL